MATATSTQDQFIALTIDPEYSKIASQSELKQLFQDRRSWLQPTSMIYLEGVEITDSNDACHAYPSHVSFLGPFSFENQCRIGIYRRPRLNITTKPTRFPTVILSRTTFGIGIVNNAKSLASLTAKLA